MTLPGSGTIKISEIVAEKGATAGSSAVNISLKGLSVDGVPDFQAGSSVLMIDVPGTPDDSAPYGMGEFYGYTQASVNNYTASTQTGGKGGSLTRFKGTPDGSATLSDGNAYGYDIISTIAATTGFRIRFFSINGGTLSAFPTAWTSVTVSSSSITDFTINRSAMTEVTVGNNRNFNLDDGVQRLAGSGSGTITFNFS